MQHGGWLWYELITPDQDAARSFYEAVTGWSIDRAGGADGMDYRMVSAADGPIGGTTTLTAAMTAAGARAAWLGYVRVDDVDAAVARAQSLGAAVHMPAMTMDGIGRFALIADPQGAPLYLMTPAPQDGSAGPPEAFSTTKPGHVSWNELATDDLAAAIDFYTALFGWTVGGTMPIGDSGDYLFLHQGDVAFGGAMRRMDGTPPTSWTFYVRVADIDAAHAAVTRGGGTVVMGPHQVPGGDHVVLGIDPQGVVFGLVGQRAAGVTE